MLIVWLMWVLKSSSGVSVIIEGVSLFIIVVFFFVLFLFLIFILLAFILFFLVVPVLFIFFFLTLFLPLLLFLLFLLFFLGGRSSSGSFPFSPLLLERLIQLVPELVHSSFVAATRCGWHFADCVIVLVLRWSAL